MRYEEIDRGKIARAIWEIMESPTGRWDAIVRLRRRGDYLAARAVERRDLAGFLLLFMIDRPMISHN